MTCKSKQDLRNHPGVLEFWKMDGHYYVQLAKGWVNGYAKNGILKATNVFGLCDLMRYTVNREISNVKGE